MTQATATSFSDLKKPIIENFKQMADQQLYTVDLDKDKIWELYIDSYAEEDKQEHRCNCCKQFLRQYAGIVTIEEGKTRTIWDNLEVPAQFRKVVDTLNEYIHSLPISDIFLAESRKGGVNESLDLKRDVIWSHFYLDLPAKVVEKVKDIPTKKALARDNKTVLQRGLEELSLEATETVLELIGQNSLYRGKEFEPLLDKFALLQRGFKRSEDKDNFCWVNSIEAGGALSRIRNTAIGTLLIDLSAGMDLDQAVTRFEKVVAPTNYKRPTSLVTPRMVEEAKAKLVELGLVSSLERRYATEADIRVCDILFKDKPNVLGDVFDEMSKETTVNPKTLKKVEEIGIEDFLANVVPTAKSISVLLENSHMNNFVSILTSQDREAPSLFKWDNNFSWSYTGAIADSIKERVKAAGGNVVGELRTSLSWYNYDDLDIHVMEPGGREIFYGNKVSPSGGKLDVDMNAGGRNSRTPVENIIWPSKEKMKEGTYRLLVHNFSKRETIDQGFEVQIECNGETFDFSFQASPKDGQAQMVAEFEYSKTTGLKFLGEVKSNSVSKEKWGVKTNQFHKVTKLMLSPNQWEKKVGNKHYMFMLEDCISDEAPRPFFNEFLKPELDKHRKVFEILGGKVKIEDSKEQLSGLGFSDTQKSSVIVKVESKFSRLLRIKF